MRPMGVTIRERKGAWWIFINHQGSRKAKRVGVGAPAKRRPSMQPNKSGHGWLSDSLRWTLLKLT